MRLIRLAPLLAVVTVPAVAQNAPTPVAPPRPALVAPVAPVRPPLAWTFDRRPSLDSALRTFATSRQYITAYQQVQSYGRCAAAAVPDIAAGVLASDPNSADERQELRQLYGVGRACLPFGYAPPTIFIRGGLAEALYTRAAVPVGPTTPAQLAVFQAGEAKRSRARLYDDRRYAALADCLVVRAPGQVRGLLLSRHGSEAERAAFDATLAAAPACGGIERLPTRAARPFLRAYLADSAWRWAEARRA